LIKTGLMMDIVVGSSLVGMYAKCNAFEKAMWLFNDMPQKDVACWNTVIFLLLPKWKLRRGPTIF